MHSIIRARRYGRPEGLGSLRQCLSSRWDLLLNMQDNMAIFRSHQRERAMSTRRRKDMGEGWGRAWAIPSQAWAKSKCERETDGQPPLWRPRWPPLGIKGQHKSSLRFPSRWLRFNLEEVQMRAGPSRCILRWIWLRHTKEIASNCISHLFALKSRLRWQQNARFPDLQRDQATTGSALQIPFTNYSLNKTSNLVSREFKRKGHQRGITRPIWTTAHLKGSLCRGLSHKPAGAAAEGTDKAKKTVNHQMPCSSGICLQTKHSKAPAKSAVQLHRPTTFCIKKWTTKSRTLKSLKN